VVDSMGDRLERTIDSRAARWLLLPALGLVLAIAAVARKAGQTRTRISHVSDSWLRAHEYAAGQHVE
jgi:hypothetical protein